MAVIQFNYLSFRFPELYGKEQCLIEIEEQDLEVYKGECMYLRLPCDEDIFNLCTLILNENDLPTPNRDMDLEVAENLYKFLIVQLEDYGLS